MNIQNYVRGLQHIGIPVQDMDISLRFYKSLGFEQAFATLDGDNRVVFMKQQNLVLELYESRQTAGKPGAIDHIALDVADIEVAFTIIHEMGCELLDKEIQFLPFWADGVKFFTIAGPNGEIVEFSQLI